VAKKNLQERGTTDFSARPMIATKPREFRKEFQPRINTDAHGFVEIELLSVRIRVDPWFLPFFWRIFAQETKLSDVSSTENKFRAIYKRSCDRWLLKTDAEATLTGGLPLMESAASSGRLLVGEQAAQVV